MELLVTCRRHFAASHRLYSDQLDEATNLEIYGKCAWKNGHGHNYVIEVTVRGTPDPITGFVIPPAELVRIVDERVVDRVDHRHLNHDIDFLQGDVPTAELLARRFFEQLEPYLSGLTRVTLHETPKNVAIYGEPETGEGR
ncbi:MAG: 6-carboxytetrahydropterin synthase [Planctomycetota bacterium]